MAAGDGTWFNDARSLAYFAGWAGTDDIKLAVLDNTTAPAAGDSAPGLADYTQVGTAGSYVSGGTSIGTWSALWTAGAIAVMDSSTNPSWAANGANDTDAYWGLLYNDTQTGDPAVAFIDLGGPVDMSAGDLNVVWDASGILRVTS